MEPGQILGPDKRYHSRVANKCGSSHMVISYGPRAFLRGLSPRWIYAGEKFQAYRASRPPLCLTYGNGLFAVPTPLAQGHTTVTTQHKVVIV
jgi:hypothetical protein